MRNKVLPLAVLVWIAAVFMGGAHAAWPDKTVRIIIPWPPGGSTDIVGRLLAAELTQRLKQQFIIDNRAGAGSIIGLQYAMTQPPDGYSLMMTSTAYGFLIDKPKLPVDLVNSFAPVAYIGMGDSAFTIHPSLRVSSIRELIDLAKKRPGAAAGLHQGDVLIAWNGDALRGVDALVRELGPSSVGSDVMLTVRRGGAVMDIPIVIAERPER